VLNNGGVESVLTFIEVNSMSDNLPNRSDLIQNGVIIKRPHYIGISEINFIGISRIMKNTLKGWIRSRKDKNRRIR
jgi:hypothetical protein